MESYDSLFLGLLVASMACAVVVFLRVQLYLADPLRRERNEQWFQQFEAYLRQRYRDPELQWRARAIDSLFHGPRSGRHGRSGGGGGGFIGAPL